MISTLSKGKVCALRTSVAIGMLAVIAAQSHGYGDEQPFMGAPGQKPARG